MWDALEGVTSLTSLNGCGQYAAIRAGGVAEIVLRREWELGGLAARFVGRNASTLTTLNVRCCRACGTAPRITRCGRGGGGVVGFAPFLSAGPV